MTLRVSPEDLGPLTVRAHIDGGGVRIELFAAGDAGREAVRHVLPELRRGLEEMGASLSLSSDDSPQTDRRPHDNSQGVSSFLCKGPVGCPVCRVVRSEVGWGIERRKRSVPGASLGCRFRVHRRGSFRCF
ncbi:flagellar hook-length control protein FliK [Paenarthrobacter ureafaciens]|uniref:flagellar hook-length control protein FliK n=1 Tax=Paenarthrobacter ureafaciens TaxID=37931 RepID=UPI003463FB39